jgi:hypothetical protein
MIIHLKGGGGAAVDAFQVASPGDLPGYPFRFKFHTVAPLSCGVIADNILLICFDTILPFVLNLKGISKNCLLARDYQGGGRRFLRGCNEFFARKNKE